MRRRRARGIALTGAALGLALAVGIMNFGGAQAEALPPAAPSALQRIGDMNAAASQRAAQAARARLGLETAAVDKAAPAS